MLYLFDRRSHCVIPVWQAESLCYTCLTGGVIVLYLFDRRSHCVIPVWQVESLCYLFGRRSHCEIPVWPADSLRGTCLAG